MYLEIKNLSKSFDGRRVVDNLSISIPKGELVCLLGPSGCGKTTTLRMLGGFLKPDGGRILLDGEDVTDWEPEQRPAATVFQSYALFPHLSVLDNVAYGLKFQKIRKSEARKTALEYLKIVGMEEYADAKIQEISGGQQQRVALARALVIKPKVLLLDEPLSNLDAKLRVLMRQEIKRIQKKFDITMLFVTHDQEEAMILSDRIIIMDQGRLIQSGNPQQVYQKPETEFVRNFLGLSNRFRDKNGEEIICRPEELHFSNTGNLRGTVLYSEFLGFYRQYYIRLINGDEIILRAGADVQVKDGEETRIRIQRI